MAINNDYEIEWSEQATRNFDDIVQLLSTSWNDKVVTNFVQSIDKELIHIKTFPYAFPATTQKEEVRRCVVSKINTIYYTVRKTTIYIVAICDNRRDPDRLNEIL